MSDDIYTVEAIQEFAHKVESNGEYHAVLCRLAWRLKSGKITAAQAKEFLNVYDYPNTENPLILTVDLSEGPT